MPSYRATQTLIVHNHRVRPGEAFTVADGDLVHKSATPLSDPKDLEAEAIKARAKADKEAKEADAAERKLESAKAKADKERGEADAADKAAKDAESKAKDSKTK